MDETRELERKKLLFNLLESVKQCQLKFNGKTLLATDKDEHVKSLLSSFENIFNHNLKEISQSTLKQFTDVTGFFKLTSILLPTESHNALQKLSFWNILEEHLSHHELERFNNLKNVKTDLGRIRAWLRSTLNEHCLEKYLHSVINQTHILRSKYESWSFMLDDEKAVTLPNLAAGISTILFALNIDKNEFDDASATHDQEIIVNLQTNDNVRTKRKKRQAKVINFEDDINESSTGVVIDSDWRFNPDDEFRLTRKSTRSDRHDMIDDISSPNVFSEDSGPQNSDTFSFEYDQHSYCSPSDTVKEESYAPLSKSEPSLKDMEHAKESKVFRFLSKNNAHYHGDTNSECLMRPVDEDGQVIDAGIFKLIDPDVVSESYGSFDSQDLVDVEVLKQQLESDEDTNRLSERTLLERDTDISQSASTDETQDQNSSVEREECLKEKLNNLEKENLMLKDQLKNYIEAMRVLEIKNNADDSDKSSDSGEVKEYEHKLVQIAEMHAELMEFNSLILKKLSQKEIQLEHAMRELSHLSRHQKGLTSESQSSVNIIIPSAFSHGSPPNTYHVYQVYIRIRNDEWNVYRRYTEFYELHCKLKKALKNIKNLDFPPKRAFGRKNPKLVEERRRKLEDYLKKAVGIMAEKCPQMFMNPSKRSLTSTIPFFDNELKLWNNSGQSTLRLHLSDDHSNQSYSGL